MSNINRKATDLDRTAEVQLPNPPAAHPQLSRGASQADAVQHAEREVSSGAIDDAGVAAGSGPLPYERVREALRRIEGFFIAGQRAETSGVGDALVTRAKRGEFTARSKSLRNASVKGAKAERADRKKVLRLAESEHEKAVEVLAATRTDSKGCSRPGEALCSEVDDVRALRRALLVAKVVDWIPVVLLLLVEGAVVAGNMRKYLRADDSDLLTPLAIAVVTVGIITLAPFFIGRLANDAAHGRSLSGLHRAAIAGSAVVWAGAAVLLAMIRVSVDRAEAIAKAQDAEYDRVTAARALGQDAELVPVDPATVFDPTLPTLFWATVFIGFGVVMVLIEIATRNPARTEELARRIATLDARASLLEAREYVANLRGVVKQQRRLTRISDQQWREELRIADAAADLDIATHLQALAQHAGSPDMLLAIEGRLSARENTPGLARPEPVEPESEPQRTLEQGRL